MPSPGQVHFLYLAAAASEERQVLRVRDRNVIGLPSPSPDTDGGEEGDRNVLALQAPSHVKLNCILALSQSSFWYHKLSQCCDLNVRIIEEVNYESVTFTLSSSITIELLWPPKRLQEFRKYLEFAGDM